MFLKIDINSTKNSATSHEINIKSAPSCRAHQVSPNKAGALPTARRP